MSIEAIFSKALADQAELLPKLKRLQPQLQRVAEAMLGCWQKRGKILIAGNGGSAADSMHFAEELVARFEKNRKALAAMALCDPTVITCAANEFGCETIFSRQVEAFGNAGDVL